MQRILIYLLTAAVTWHIIGTWASGQLVQVAPGYVKAPFVRVYSYPDGSSFVRAPFVGVYTPGHHPHYSHHSDADELQRMDWRSLGQAIRQWNARLDADLNRFPSGDFWKASLKVGDIAGLVPPDRDGPPDEAARQQLRAIFESQRTIVNSPEVNAVADLTSFRMLHAALGEYSSAPDERLLRQLAESASDLRRSLRRYKTGPGWQNYLMVSSGMTLSREQLSAPSESTAGELAKALEVYNSVNQNDQFRTISQLPSFKATHECLAAYLNQPRTSTSAHEELVLPKPDGRL